MHKLRMFSQAASLTQTPQNDSNLRRRRRRRRGFPRIRLGAERLLQQGQQGAEAAVRVQGVRHRPRRVHQQRGAVYSAEDDGGKQSEGSAVAADCRQDDHGGGLGWGWEDQLRGVHEDGGEYGC